MIFQDAYMNTNIRKKDHFVIATDAIISCIMNGTEISIMQLIEKSRSRNGENLKRSI